MRIDSYTFAVLRFAARVADRTGLFALLCTGVGLVIAFALWG